MTQNQQTSPIQTAQVNQENYHDFCRLLLWRRTGEEPQSDVVISEKAFCKEADQQTLFTNDQFFIFGAIVGNKFVGYITASVIPKPDARLGTLFVDELWVAPAYRRRGIAKSLMNQVVTKAKQLNLWQLRLYVTSENDNARNFYRQFGLKEKSVAIFCEQTITDQQKKEE